jgi:phosphoglycolate phosphatase-like HAD superfamily hydrolase
LRPKTVDFVGADIEDDRMNISLLDQHDVIAWDLDGTLVNGENSRLLCEYILAHPEKTHHFITFRTPHDWAQDIFRELQPVGITRFMIASVQSVPEHLYFAYASETAEDANMAHVSEFYAWKGMRAAELGCTALVDDMRALVIRGCLLHGVTYVDANDPALTA